MSKRHREDDYPLFPDHALARRSDPGTSHAAAESLSREAVSRLCAAVFACVDDSGERGLTTREVSAITGIDWGSVTPRIQPLVKSGMLRDSGRKRLTGSRRQAIVWVSARFCPDEEAR